MIIATIKSCSPAIYAGLQNYLLPCPFKYFTGIDCPGCGFQRSLLALLQGNLQQSIALYPATIPLLLIVAYTILSKFARLDNSRNVIRKTAYIAVAFIILVSYSIKMLHLHNL